MSAPDYTSLITSEHRVQPNFVATVDMTANAVGDITNAIDSLPELFDIDLALQQQLDIDGQWIGFARTVGGVVLVGFFGFADDSTALGFGELSDSSVGARFIELGEDTSTTATLADPEYRLLLKAKIIQNDWDASIAEFEAAAADIIPVPCQFLDLGDSVVSILPSQTLDPVLVQLLTGFDLLPRPAGVRYQLLGPMAIPYVWTVAGTASASGTTVSKPSGVSAWDSSAYIAQPLPACFLQWKATSTTTQTMGGLSTNPSGSPNYPTLNYGLYLATGGIQVYESGALKGTFGSYIVGDSFSVLCDKRTVFYLHNGSVIYRSLVAVPGSLSPMFCLDTPGASISNVSIQTGN